MFLIHDLTQPPKKLKNIDSTPRSTTQPNPLVDSNHGQLRDIEYLVSIVKQVPSEASICMRA